MDRALPMAIPKSPLGTADHGEERLALAENLVRGSVGPEQSLQAARIFALEGRRDRAVEVLRQGILTHPQESAMLTLLADLLSRSGTFEEADLYFRRAIESEPGNPEHWYRRGLHDGRRGQMAHARTAYEEAVRLDPRLVRGWVNLGLACADLGDRGGAVRALERAVQVDPGCGEAHSNLGALYAEAGLHAESVEEFRRAVALAPDSSEARFNLGLALLHEDDLEQAEATLVESTRLDAANVESLCALALLHLRVGSYARAVVDLKRALEHRPEDARFHYYLGVAYNGQDAVDQAILSLETAARLRPADPRIHRLLGVAYDKKELPSRAREAYRRAAALNG